ncbi:MAG: efflux RND transporter periplasmic adaptor subunit [Candidatus Moraniibacteriota bacterium]
MNKQKIILSLVLVAALFIGALKFSGKKTVLPTEVVKRPISISVQSVGDSRTLVQKKNYAASVVGDQEVKITAKSAGTVVVAPGTIGSRVGAGALLVKIDDTGTLAVGGEGLKNLQVQQSENAVAQAKKSYQLAKDVYESVRKSDTSTGAQKDTAKAQVTLTKLQYDNALLGLNGSVDNHLILSPLSGIITSKNVAVGDSVAVGQLLASVSQSANIKVQFYVDQDERALLVVGQTITALDANNNPVSLLIRNIAIAADPTTKRFLVEAYPQKSNSGLLSGTIANVSIETTLVPRQANDFILPLSAINIGQNESYVFVADGTVAKKTPVTVSRVNGEMAEISAPLSVETRIITTGSKLVHDGEAIVIQN